MLPVLCPRCDEVVQMANLDKDCRYCQRCARIVLVEMKACGYSRWNVPTWWDEDLQACR